MTDATDHPRGRLRAALDAHWPILAVLAVAVLARAVVAIAYAPALMFPDSWSYVGAAYGDSHLGGIRPPGYGLTMFALEQVTGPSLGVVTALQHVAGLGIGVIVYALLLRLGTGRLIATVAAAVVLLDGYAIALEQHILAETFTTAAMVASVALLLTTRSALPLAVAGLLLAVAVLMRTPTIFLVPFWVAYLLLRHRPARAWVAPLLGLGVTLAAFMVVNQAQTGRSGLTNADGWFLYGRTAALADCTRFTPPAGTEPLCEPPGHAGRPPIFYVWSPESPAQRHYGRVGAPGSDDELRAFAVATLRSRPLAFAQLVGEDLVRYADPSAETPGGSDGAITLPEEPRTMPGWLDVEARDRYVPGYEPEVAAPAGLARAYAHVVRFPRPLLVVLVALPLVALVVALRRPRPGRRLAEIALLSGGGIALIAGATLTSAFVVRYMVPALPLLVAGAALAVAELSRRPGAGPDSAAARRPAADPTPPRSP
ncbi:MAG: hypothetical protein ABW060_01135 [Solirubrobacteraceae bacterium]